MLKIKDLTRDQAIQIAKLAYGYPELIRSKDEEFVFRYVPYVDDQHIVTVSFDATLFGGKEAIFNVIICHNLDVTIFTPMDGRAYIVENQRQIQMKFIEWELKEFEKDTIETIYGNIDSESDIDFIWLKEFQQKDSYSKDELKVIFNGLSCEITDIFDSLRTLHIAEGKLIQRLKNKEWRNKDVDFSEKIAGQSGNLRRKIKKYLRSI